MAPYPTGTCANCTNHGVLKYARRTMCTRYKCQKAATAERVARLADGGGDDAVVPTYCFEIKEVIGMRFADPERLVGKKRRNELAAAETSLFYLENLNRALKRQGVPHGGEKGGGRRHCRL